MSRALSLAGFQVTIIGRFWVITEGLLIPIRSFREIAFSSAAAVGAGVGATKEGKMAPNFS